MEKATQVQAPVMPPSHIKPSSSFSPRLRQCCQCTESTLDENQRCIGDSCGHVPCQDCPVRDARGREVIPHSFPVDWVCSSCGITHSVLELLVMKVRCECDNPTLQTVYDQFGRIFLYWREDPDVYDLRDPIKVQEAAWRVWEAGSEPWLADVIETEKMMAKARDLRGFSHYS